MNQLEQAITGMRKEATELAERKLGRSLTDTERAGLENVKSGMMFEAISRSFAFEGYSAEQVAADLACFAKKI
jgi:hypothetical protein